MKVKLNALKLVANETLRGQPYIVNFYNLKNLHLNELAQVKFQRKLLSILFFIERLGVSMFFTYLNKK